MLFRIEKEEKLYVVETTSLELYCDYICLPISFFRVQGSMILNDLLHYDSTNKDLPLYA